MTAMLGRRLVRKRRVTLSVVALCAVFQLAMLLAVGLLSADSHRQALFAARSGVDARSLPPQAETELGPAPVALRSTIHLPSSAGAVTWTRVLPLQAEQLAAAVPRSPGTYVSPALRALIARRDPFLRAVFGSDLKTLGAESLIAPDELVAVSVLTPDDATTLSLPERVGQDAVGPTASPNVEQARLPTLIVLGGVAVTAVALVRVLALVRMRELALLRLIGYTPGQVRRELGLQVGVCWLAAGGVVVALTHTGLRGAWTISVFGIPYYAAELNLPLGSQLGVLGLSTAVVILISIAGLRRVAVDPLAVYVQSRERRSSPRSGTRPVLLGLLALAVTAIAARFVRAPDAVLLVGYGLSLVLLTVGLVSAAPIALRAAVNACREPLVLFVAARQVAASPWKSLRAAAPVGLAMAAAGLVGAIGPASITDEQPPRAFGDAVVVAAATVDAPASFERFTAELPPQAYGLLSSDFLAVDGVDYELFRGSCEDLRRAGVTWATGSCLRGSLVALNADSYEPGEQVNGEIWTGRTVEPIAAPVSATASTDGGSAFFVMPTGPEVGQPNTLVIPAGYLAEVLRAYAQAPPTFEVRVPSLDDAAARSERRFDQQQVSAVFGTLALLASVSAAASTLATLWERRASLTALRLNGFTATTVRVIGLIGLAFPLLLCAGLGGLVGYGLGSFAGLLLDGRAPSSPGYLLSWFALVLVAVVVLSTIVSYLAIRGGKAGHVEALR